MTTSRSDALVLFGVTGDLAHKMIFPELYAMARRRARKVPVIGVAFPKWSLARLRARVTASSDRAGSMTSVPSIILAARRTTLRQHHGLHLAFQCERRILTTSTEQRAWHATVSETLPIKNRSNPVCPIEPRTINSAFHCSAASRIFDLGSPFPTAVVTFRLLLRSISANLATRSSACLVRASWSLSRAGL